MPQIDYTFLPQVAYGAKGKKRSGGVMGFPAKDYYRLQTLQKLWEVSQEDMFYAIENDLLRTCIWLPLRFVEKGVIRKRKFIYESHEHQEGFVGVRSKDCHLICSNGRAKLRIFNSICDDGYILRLAYEPPQPSICVRLHELVVLQKDKNKFENTYDITESNIRELHPEKDVDDFIVSEDYRYAKLSGHEFHLGDVQSQALELLHDAAQSQKPWVHGKTLIFESGSNATRFRDIFKNKPHWRKLIISNERGYYRLNIPLETAKKSTSNITLDYAKTVSQ